MAESNGVWFDKDSGKVVNKQPTNGRQIVAPGKEITDAEQAVIDRWKGEDEEPKTVTSSTAKSTTKTSK